MVFRVFPEVGLGVEQMLVTGGVVDWLALQIVAHAISDDDRRWNFAQVTDHGQFFGPDVENLAEEFGLLGRIGFDRDLIPGRPNVANPVIGGWLLGIGVGITLRCARDSRPDTRGDPAVCR